MRARKPIADMTGQKFGKLTVLSYHHTDTKIKNNQQYNKDYYLCQCECGNTTIVDKGSLKYGHTKSCGCLIKDILTTRNKTEKMRQVTINRNKTDMLRHNTWDLSGEYGIGYTTKGEPFYFDLEDYDKIKNYCWSMSKGYVECAIKAGDKFKHCKMHQLLMNAKYIDHINRVTYDNRKSNLRLANPQNNSKNHKLQSNNTTGISGVTHNKKYDRWIARINIDSNVRKTVYYGVDREEAIKARLEAESKYYGEFAPQRDLFKQYGIEET
jgi:NACalpha-BTF3-like transcription factor